jgi:hypothetical protein
MTPTTDHEYQLPTDVMIVPVRSLGDTLRVMLFSGGLHRQPTRRAPSPRGIGGGGLSGRISAAIFRVVRCCAIA